MQTAQIFNEDPAAIEDTLKKTTVAFIKKLLLRYGKSILFLDECVDKKAAPTQDEMKHSLKKWYLSLRENSVNFNKLQDFCDYLFQLNKYMTFPPRSISEFISIYSEWILLSSEHLKDIPEDYKIEFERLFKRLAIRFDNLMRSNILDMKPSDIKNFWLQSLYFSGISPSVFDKAFSEISEFPEFIKFAPNTEQFIEVAQIIQSGDDIPFPLNAFDYACSNYAQGTNHPVVHCTIVEFGKNRLLKGCTKTKADFEIVYRKNLKKFLKGKLKVIEKKNVVVSNSPKAAISDVNNVLDEILSKL